MEQNRTVEQAHSQGGLGARPPEVSKCSFVPPPHENFIASIICFIFFIFISLRDLPVGIGALNLQTSTKTDYGITFLFCLEINDQNNLHLA